MPDVRSQPPLRSAPGDRPDNDPEVSNEAQAKNFFVSATSVNDLNGTFFQNGTPSMSTHNQIPDYGTQDPSLELDAYSHVFSPATVDQTFPTSDYSPENLYSDPSIPHTPSWDETLWDSHTGTDKVGTGLLGANGLANETAYSLNDFESTSHPSQIMGDQSHGSALPAQMISPQMTNTPSPAGQYSNMNTMSPADLSNNTGRQAQLSAYSKPSAGLRVNPHHTPAQSNSSNGSLHVSPSDAAMRAPSPILLVSSYNRGDSPARSAPRMERSSSKRSRTEQDSNYLAPSGHYTADEEADETLESLEHDLPTVSRTEDGAWEPSVGGPGGLSPTNRGDIYVPSLKDIEEKRQQDKKNQEVADWLEKSEAGSDYGDRRRVVRRARPRARSTGDRGSTLYPVPGAGSGLPGPGMLVDEDSGDAYTEETVSQFSMEDGAASPPAQVDSRVNFDVPETNDDYFSSPRNAPQEEKEPTLSQFIGIRLSEAPHANAAMFRYEQMAAKFETASRAATWGTRRRMSDPEIQSIISGDVVRKLSLAEKTRKRGTTLVRKASNLIPKRSPSNSRKRDPDTLHEDATSSPPQKSRNDSLTSFSTIQRMSSIGKGQRSPPLTTRSALAAMTGSITAVGRSTSATPETGNNVPVWKSIKRQRSKSDITKGKATSPGLAQLMTNLGGPPMPALASPMQERPVDTIENGQEEAGEEMDAEGALDSQAVKIDLAVRADPIIPTTDGFRIQVQHLNPRLEIFLTERIVSEQQRRYKKLVENKVKHTGVVKATRCPSKEFCFDQGGEAKELPPRPNSKDPDAAGPQFQVAGNDDSEGEGNTFSDGVVTAAQFPGGIPLPPVKKLPAEFECPLCFKVKKFQKPSDWTKHVHEDVQPFTCTFPNCSEARSFKRKADWVRHENERHRQLEWWQCDMPDCIHKCFRKDNFVQHLVREHKKREPKVKSRSGKATSGSVTAWRDDATIEAEIDEVWKQVDRCHFETQKKPREEACKFCGNVCSSWKRLTVHLAKHMEQIAMPVLDIVKRKEVSPNTIISPVDRNPHSQAAIRTNSPANAMKNEQHTLSPFGVGVASNYAAMAAQSPAYSHDSPYSHSMHSPNFSHTPNSGYDPVVVPNPSMAEFAQMHNLPENMSYGPYQINPQPTSFAPMTTATPATSTYPPPFNAIRRSPQIVTANHAQTHPGFGPVHPGYDVQQHQQQPQQPVYMSPTDSEPYNMGAYTTTQHMNALQGFENDPAAYDTNGLGGLAPQELYEQPGPQRYAGNNPSANGYNTYTRQ